jgi:hypothetical protein
MLIGSPDVPPLGYDSESGESSDTGVEVWEDEDALREEGVEVAAGRRGAVRRVRRERGREGEEGSRGK